MTKTCSGMQKNSCIADKSCEWDKKKKSCVDDQCDDVVCDDGSRNQDTCELFSGCNCVWDDEANQEEGEGECVEGEETNNNNNETVETNRKTIDEFGNILSGFEFNDSCMIITIVFIILFMYKEEIMKSTIVKKLLK